MTNNNFFSITDKYISMYIKELFSEANFTHYQIACSVYNHDKDRYYACVSELVFETTDDIESISDLAKDRALEGYMTWDKLAIFTDEKDSLRCIYDYITETFETEELRKDKFIRMNWESFNKAVCFALRNGKIKLHIPIH